MENFDSDDELEPGIPVPDRNSNIILARNYKVKDPSLIQNTVLD